MARKYKRGEVAFRFAGIDGKAETLGDDILVRWCGRRQFYATLSPAVRACVISAVFKAGLVVC